MAMSLEVLYEDNHIIVVVKPAGVLVQPSILVDGTINNLDLVEMVKRYLKEKYKKPGNIFLGIVHRLDRPVSGIVLFAKTSKGAARLSEQFRDRTIKKIYSAIIEGEISPKDGYLMHSLVKDQKTKKSFVDQSGSMAELRYRTVKSNGKFSLLEIEIKTGRFHQIRAQFSAIGHPIAGDVKYGASKMRPDRSITLCATGLKFRKATDNEWVELRIKYPQNWEEFM